MPRGFFCHRDVIGNQVSLTPGFGERRTTARRDSALHCARFKERKPIAVKCANDFSFVALGAELLPIGIETLSALRKSRQRLFIRESRLLSRGLNIGR